MSKNTSFILALLLPLVIGLMAASLAPQSAQVYTSFQLPPLAPPPASFGIVWTCLYILMGMASYIIYRSKVYPAVKRHALGLYALQLGMNFLWTYFFFVQGWRLFALVWLVALTSLVYACMRAFKYISFRAFLLLVPYFLWCLFAIYLNSALIFLNG